MTQFSTARILSASLSAAFLAACSSDPIAPSAGAGRVSLHEVSAGATQTAMVCKAPGSPAGSYTFNVTFGGNANAGDVQVAQVVLQPGQCETVFTRTQSDGNVDEAASIVVTEAAAPGTTLSSIVTPTYPNEPGSGAQQGSTNLMGRTATVYVNAFHSAIVTFTNAAAPTVCTYTQGFYQNRGARTGLVANLLGQTHAYIQGGELFVGGSTVGGATLDKNEIAAIFELSARGGNAEIILLHQLITAELNVIRGASAPGIADLITEAQNLLVGGITTQERARAIEIAGLLDQFNNGVYPGGPAHCDA